MARRMMINRTSRIARTTRFLRPKCNMKLLAFRKILVALPHDLRMRFRSRTNPEIFQKKRELRFLIFFSGREGFIIINQRTRAAIALQDVGYQGGGANGPCCRYRNFTNFKL
jgi:hypothetical protein